MNKLIFTVMCFLVAFTACGNHSDPDESLPSDENPAKRNLSRSIQIVDKAISSYFVGDDMAMSRYYNPYTGVRSAEKGSVWMYTSSIEAVNAILEALKIQKEKGDSELYDKHYNRYVDLLAKLYAGAAFYKGTYTLTSYTQTREWSVYGVDRGAAKGMAAVDGIHNVYDDQQWLIRELLQAYKITGNSQYLSEAEYLTCYVLDGWDCVLDASGKEYGGITWGPGYVTKHSCSNGPFVSPLVWLYGIYKAKDDVVVYRYIDKDGSRKRINMKKSDYYLKFAQAVYDWQKNNLMRPDGVYYDMMGGCDPSCDVAYEMVDGVQYRKHVDLHDKVGTAYTYNCGTMLSGAIDLYNATGNNQYLTDATQLTDASFSFFAQKDQTIKGYYTYPLSGFSTWFNGVLMRGYVDAYPLVRSAATGISTFQQNLDYGYEKFLHEGFLPTNLLVGWNIDANSNNMEGMFMFTFGAEYATLAKYELQK